MQRARLEGVVKASAMTTPSQRGVCHARPTSIWLSVALNGTLTDAAAYATTRIRSKALVAPCFDFADCLK
jgi:hypothetical protein